MKAPTIGLDVHFIERADLLVFAITVHNDTDAPIPAGFRVGVFGDDEGEAVRYWTFTLPEALPPGETWKKSTQGPLGRKELDMAFSARELEAGEAS